MATQNPQSPSKAPAVPTPAPTPAAKPVKSKTIPGEAAIARLVRQLNSNTPDINSRQYTPLVFASLVLYLAEANGATFNTPAGREAFRAEMQDGDFAYASNMKKYLASRGLFPTKETLAQSDLE